VKNPFIPVLLILVFFSFSYGKDNKIEELEKLCEKGSGKACYELASIYFKVKEEK